MVPPRGRMPFTSLSVSSKAFSGQIRPSNPSGMPMTFHPYLMTAALVAARMTALRPGASPPPVPMPIQRMLVENPSFVVSRSSLVVRGWWLGGRRSESRRYDNFVTSQSQLTGVRPGSERLIHSRSSFSSSKIRLK